MKRSIVVLMMIVVFCQVAFSSKKVAVLFCGTKAPVWDTPVGDTSFWLDTFLMWEMLRLSGFEDKNIYVLYGNGLDYPGNGIYTDRYNPSFNTEDSHDLKITDFPATLYSLENDLMLHLDRFLTEDDLLFVWTYGHCQTTSESFGLITQNDIITPTKFAELFTPLKAYKKIYVMAQSYGERFKEKLTTDGQGNPYDNVVFISSTKTNQTYSIADDLPEDQKSPPQDAPDVKGIENDTWGGIPHYHSEFNFHIYGASAGRNTYGNDYYYKDLIISDVPYGSVYYSEVDGFDIQHGGLNDQTKDGLITIDEVRQWADYYESSETETQAFSDLSSIAKHTSLVHPQILSSRLCEYSSGQDIQPGSYILEEEHRGDVLITSNLDISYGTFKLWPKSKTIIQGSNFVSTGVETIFDNCSVVGSNKNLIDVWENKIRVINSYIENLTFKIHPFCNAFFSSANRFANTEIFIYNNARLILENGAFLNIGEGVDLSLSTDSAIEIRDNSVLHSGNSGFNFEYGTGLFLKDNSSLAGMFGFDAGSKFEVSPNATVTISSGSDVTMNEVTLRIRNNAELIIEEGATLDMQGPMTIIMSEGSKITVNGTLNANGNIVFKNDILDPELDKAGDKWLGLYANTKSKIYFNGIKFTDCVNAISGSPEICRIVNCAFENCTNGINLVNCTEFEIEGNKLTGNGEGVGITMTQCSDILKGNAITNFIHGIDIILCPSITLVKNIVTDNRDYGLYITGYNAIPLLVNATGKNDELNNEIYNNGVNRKYYEGGQIFMKYSAGISMNNGFNNIYSPMNGDVPEVPAIRGVSHLASSKVDLPNKVSIMAEYNYWGYDAIGSSNYKNFFDLWKIEEISGYNLDFRPYAKNAYKVDGEKIIYSETEQNEPESQILYTAIKLEQMGNLKPSIQLYEQIIRKHEDTPEYYVAMSRLPYLYSEIEKDTDDLIKTYDDALLSPSVTNKKFLKEMKISTYLKSKKYDNAILVAEELKASAQTLDEILLAELDIAIAEMMKDAQGKNNKGADDNSRINNIIAKLGGNNSYEPASSPSDLAEIALPEKHELFQNYPNPFNPVTQIGFALAKTTDVRLTVYNIAGQKVAELANGTKQAGVHAVEFDGAKLNSGVYYYALEVDGVSLTKKLVLTK
jgi:hypothetical protein